MNRLSGQQYNRPVPECTRPRPPRCSRSRRRNALDEHSPTTFSASHPAALGNRGCRRPRLRPFGGMTGHRTDIGSRLTLHFGPGTSKCGGVSNLPRWVIRVLEHLDNVPGQRYLNLPVTRNRLNHAGMGIAIPIVPGTVADEQTSESFDCLDQVDSLHNTTRSSTLRTLGTCPAVMSR